MEILQIILTVLAVLAVLMAVKWADDKFQQNALYLKVRHPFRKPVQKSAPPSTRMFVAIRRQPAGRMTLSAADAELYEATKQNVNEKLQDLLKGWLSLTKFTFGFHGSEYGLPSNNDENWLLFASFEVENHDNFRDCLSFLGQEQFFALRNQFDIRLLYGEQIENLGDHSDELFS